MPGPNHDEFRAMIRRFLSCPVRRGGILIFLVLSSLTTPVLSLDGPVQTSRLVVTRWQGQTLGWNSEGEASWLQDSAGNLRLDLLAGYGTLDSLLDWQGAEGWTLILASTGDGTINRWNEEWQLLDSSLAGWIRFLAAVTGPDEALDIPDHVRLRGGGAQMIQDRGPWQFIPRIHRYEVGELKQGPRSLRDISRQRGLGKGGEETMVRWRPLDGTEFRFALSTSRYPGQILVGQPRVYSVSFDSAVAFLPWWSLRQALSFD